MLNKEEIVDVKISSSNKKWFENLGYGCHFGQYISVKASDLKPTSKAIVHPICDYCGKATSITYGGYYQVMKKNIVNKYACKECAGRKNSDVRLRNEVDNVFKHLEEICNEEGYTLITKKEDYKGEAMQCSFICPKHGEKTMTISNIFSGHRCIDCSYEDRSNKIRKPVEVVKSDIESFNNNKLLNPEDYVSAVTNNLIVLCGSCNRNTFTVSYANYMSHNINKCRCCASVESSGEAKIREYLENHDIQYIHEKRFSDCVDKRSLPFDYYLQDYNAIIEYDGEQHFYPVYGEENFAITKLHDEIKNKYCKDNQISLLRIPYWEKDNIDDKVKEYIKTL